MDKVYDLIIIGGGPAGITAGIYAARQNLNTLLITKGFGGQMAVKAVDIENYPGFKKVSGMDLVKEFENHLKKFSKSSGSPGQGEGFEIKNGSVVEVKKDSKTFSVITDDRTQCEAKTVIITSGADPRPLEVPGEKEFIGRGVSYCSTCDGPLFEGKTVAVIGGGNSGFESAIALANFAKKIYILEYGQEVGADKVNQERAKATGKVEIMTSAALQKIQGKDFVDLILWQDRKSKKINTLKIDGVFVAIGLQPATSFVNGLVDFSEKDEIKINPRTCETRTPGLFAAGDVSDVEYKQIVIACGEGAKAALSAYEYLQRLK